MTVTPSLFQRLRLLAIVILTMAFAMPAFESHACAPEQSSTATQFIQTVGAPADLADPCKDCGPACANGCCHAPHFAVMPDLLVEPPSAPTYAAPAAWADASAAPDLRPDGPDRPPRL